MVDTLIVGAGSAGCVLANRLSADPARRVLLLEAGATAPKSAEIPAHWPRMFGTAVDWGFHTEPQPGCRMRRMYRPRGRVVGGSGALNAMIYMRGVPSDCDRWAAAGCTARSAGGRNHGPRWARKGLQTGAQSRCTGWATHASFATPEPACRPNPSGRGERPLSRGAVRLRSADPLEAPSIDPRYFSDPQGADLRLVVEGIRLQRRIAAESPLREVLAGEFEHSASARSDADLADFVRAQAMTLYHPTSTCAMGTGAMAVVDPTCRVRGAEGLRVADASVLPTMVSGNTNAPTIMVAERAADFILKAATAAAEPPRGLR